MDLFEKKQQLIPLLPPSEVSKIIGVDVKTLAVWRCTKRYALPFCKIGRSVMYRPDDVQAFINGRMRGEAI
jgi:hypothetical protein